MNRFHDLQMHLLAEAKADEVGLWYIINNVRRDFHLTDPTAVRQLTMDMVRSLLASDAVKAGFYASDGSGFKVWSMPNDSVLQHIEMEWNRLGREPNIGEVVIFVAED